MDKLSLPNKKLLILIDTNRDISSQWPHQRKDPFIDAASFWFSHYPHDIHLQDSAFFTSRLNKGSINAYPEVDYNEWLQGCPVTIQGRPNAGCQALFAVVQVIIQSEHRL